MATELYCTSCKLIAEDEDRQHWWQWTVSPTDEFNLCPRCILPNKSNREFLKLCYLAGLGSGSELTTIELRDIPPIREDDLLNHPRSQQSSSTTVTASSSLTGAEYSYASLNSSQIRVLTLLPGSKIDAIHCQMDVVDFTEEYSDYSALSYCWGSPTQGIQKIYIDGCEFSVLRNLYHALVALRRPNGKRRLWIDAICIRQDDNMEKKTQIPLMGRVYSQCQSVVIWLGNSTPSSDFVMQCIGTRDVERIQTFAFFHAFTSFLERDWFTRTWIVQELALNKTPPQMLCGSRFQISWSQFVATFQFAVRTKPVGEPPTEQLPLSTGHYKTLQDRELTTVHKALLQFKILTQWARAMARSTTLTLDSIRAALIDEAGRLRVRPLYRLLTNTSGLNVTSNHDKIYGLQGMIDERLLHHLPIDYDSPLQKVYGNAVEYMLTYEEALFIFLRFPMPVSIRDLRALLKESANTSDWPSWVPVFSSKEASLIPGSIDDDWAFLYPFRPLDFQAPTIKHYEDPKPKPQFAISEQMLISMGTVVGIIDNTIESSMSSEPITQGADQKRVRTLAEIDHLCRANADALGLCPVDEAWITAIWEELLLGYGGLANLNGAQFRQAVEDSVGTSVPPSQATLDDQAAKERTTSSLRQILKSRDVYLEHRNPQEADELEDQQAILRDMSTTLRPAADRNPKRESVGAEAFRSALWSIFADRKRFFTMTAAGLWGIGLCNVQVGDVVAFLFPPWHIPFVLRRNEGEDTYKMIGPAILPSKRRMAILEKHPKLATKKFCIA